MHFQRNLHTKIEERVKKKIRVPMLLIFFAFFMLFTGLAVGFTYSGFQSQATSSGTLDFITPIYDITLDNANATTNGTSTIYEKYVIGIFQNSACTTEITTSQNNITIPARVYTIGFDSNGGSACTTQTATYIFNGYYTANTGGTQLLNANGYTTSNFTPTYFNSNSTLHAQWISTFITLPTPTRTGYTFDGWYNESSLTNKAGDAGASYTPTANKTLYAKWSANAYSITYHLSGGSYGGSHPNSATYNVGFTVDNPTKAGYIFTGWEITGMDSCVHTYGTNTTTNSTINSTKATNFMNLRSTSGTVTFTANWIVTYIDFSSPNSFTINVNNNTKNWDGTLYYSTNLSSWYEWNGTTINSGVMNGLNHIYLRGKNNTKITGTSTSSSNDQWVLNGSSISCSGNIENLLNYEVVGVGNHPTMSNYCYAHMFSNCASLVEAPALPATTLTDGCYNLMFHNCTNLATSPLLPATTLAYACYTAMFRGCTSLQTAPVLSATGLANYCYVGMFWDCKSLVSAPALPATGLADNCYQQMFYGCTNLVNIPALPAITLAKSCYSNMFNGCTRIKISQTQVGEYQKAYRIPTSGTGTTASQALVSMFYGTGGTFASGASINTTYYLSTSNGIVMPNGTIS